jgi:3-dehydroquinate synthase
MFKFTPSGNLKNPRAKILFNFSAIYYSSMEYSRKKSEIIFADAPEAAVSHILTRYAPGKIFVVTEHNVHQLWFKDTGFFGQYPLVVLPSNEENKKIGTVAKVWEFLSQNGADRKSLLVSVGGGMLTDLCGFAASTFKRGIDFLNIPTTLLSQVDASVGGKTGINFNGLKNEIGTFYEPEAVVISTGFLRTLDKPNLCSGFAEMIKHGLIFSPDHLAELMPLNPETPDYDAYRDYIRHSVEIKDYFVLHDPKEKNIRKALNFGHTVGHALESLAMEQHRPVLHGYAVAWGMVAELYLSHVVSGFSEKRMLELSRWLIGLYGRFDFSSADYDRLFTLMQHDKKNEANRIHFTLLADVGRFVIDQHADPKTVYEALDFLNHVQR